METYKVFKDYFRRDAVLVKDLTDLNDEEVMRFLEKHQSFIMKPLTAACGRGIQIVRAPNRKAAFDMLKSVLLKSDTGYMIEGLINQDEAMAEFHSQSVNTVRVPTFNLNGVIKVVRPFLRTGCGNAVVDNAGSGGVFAVIDADTGIALAAADEYNKCYSEHPDSRKRLIGFAVPRRDETLETAKKLAMVLPDVKYVGWDLALPPDGWVLVKGNDKGQFVFQYPMHKGFRKELDELRSRM